VTIINNTTIINKTYSDNQHRANLYLWSERESVQKVTGKICSDGLPLKKPIARVKA
jgi:phosphopantetheinyl transferase